MINLLGGSSDLALSAFYLVPFSFFCLFSRSLAFSTDFALPVFSASFSPTLQLGDGAGEDIIILLYDSFPQGSHSIIITFAFLCFTDSDLFFPPSHDIYTYFRSTLSKS